MLAALVLLAVAYRGEPVTVWTKDGRYLLYESCVDFCSGESRARAEDTRTGEMIFFEEGEGGDAEVDAKRAAWVETHPTVAVKASRVSPDGKASAEVELTAEASTGSWSDGTWTSGGRTEWSLSVKRDGKSKRSATSGGGAWVRAYWSPDGKRVLWEIEHGGHGMRDPGYEEQIFGPVRGPAIALSLGGPDLQHAAPIADLLEAKGYPIVRTIKAKATRAKSMIFARAGFEAVAQQIAAVLPGGAAIDKLDSASDRDIIVSVGKSAFSAQK